MYKTDILNSPPAIGDEDYNPPEHFDAPPANPNPTAFDVAWQWAKLGVLIFAAVAVACVAWLFVVNFVFTWFDLWDAETKARADAAEILSTTACAQRTAMMPNNVCSYASQILEHDKTLVVMHKFGREVAGTFPVIGHCLVDNDSCQTMWVYMIESVKGSMLYIVIALALAFAIVYVCYIERTARKAVEVTRNRRAGPRLPGPDTPNAVRQATDIATGSSRRDYMKIFEDAYRIGVVPGGEKHKET